jgi:hypothetical protein
MKYQRRCSMAIFGSASFQPAFFCVSCNISICQHCVDTCHRTHTTMVNQAPKVFSCECGFQDEKIFGPCLIVDQLVISTQGGTNLSGFFIRWLPPELVLFILSFLYSTTLTRMLRVHKCWKLLLSKTRPANGVLQLWKAEAMDTIEAISNRKDLRRARRSYHDCPRLYDGPTMYTRVHMEYIRRDLKWSWGNLVFENPKLTAKLKAIIRFVTPYLSFKDLLHLKAVNKSMRDVVDRHKIYGIVTVDLMNLISNWKIPTFSYRKFSVEKKLNQIQVGKHGIYCLFEDNLRQIEFWVLFFIQLKTVDLLS